MKLNFPRNVSGLLRRSDAFLSSSTAGKMMVASAGLVSLPSIHRIIPNAIARPRKYAFTCESASKRYPHCQMLAFGSAECEDRRGPVNLGVARYRRRITWKIRSWFPAAGSSARNVTGGRKLARHDSYCWSMIFIGKPVRPRIKSGASFSGSCSD